MSVLACLAYGSSDHTLIEYKTLSFRLCTCGLVKRVQAPGGPVQRGRGVRPDVGDVSIEVEARAKAGVVGSLDTAVWQVGLPALADKKCASAMVTITLQQLRASWFSNFAIDSHCMVLLKHCFLF
jgi:hypothetical protein